MKKNPSAEQIATLKQWQSRGMKPHSSKGMSWAWVRPCFSGNASHKRQAGIKGANCLQRSDFQPVTKTISRKLRMLPKIFWSVLGWDRQGSCYAYPCSFYNLFCNVQLHESNANPLQLSHFF